jgi:hypothetical protein
MRHCLEKSPASGVSYTISSWPIDPAVTARWQADRLVLERRIAVLRNVPLLAGLSKAHVRSLARLAAIRTYLRSATVVNERETATFFFVIVDGTARVVRGG